MHFASTNGSSCIKITPATLREVYGIEADVIDVMLASGEARRICVPRSGPGAGPPTAKSET